MVIHNIFNAKLDTMNEMHYLCEKNCFYIIMTYYGYTRFETLALMNAGLTVTLKITQDMWETDITHALHPICDTRMLHISTDGFFEEVLNSNLSSIISDQLIVVIVDIYHLPYRSEYHKTHGSHCVILAGYNTDTKEVAIIDEYPPYYYRGWLQICEYKAARTSMNNFDSNPYSGMPINNSHFIVDVKNIYNNRKCLLLNSLDYMSGRIEHISYYQRSKSCLWIVGKNALLFLLRRIRNMKSKQEFIVLHHTIFIYYRNTIFTREFVKAVCSEYHLDKFREELIECINYLINLSKKINYLVLKEYALLNGSCTASLFELLTELHSKHIQWEIYMIKIKEEII